MKDTGIERVAVKPLESATRIFRTEFSGRLGFPLRIPVLASRFSPRGSPFCMDHLNGGSPPVAVKVMANASCTLLEITSGEELTSRPYEAMSKVKDCSVVLRSEGLESSASKLKENDPSALGTPEILPFAKVRPAGRGVLFLTAKWMGGTPPWT